MLRSFENLRNFEVVYANLYYATRLPCNLEIEQKDAQPRRLQRATILQLCQIDVTCVQVASRKIKFSDCHGAIRMNCTDACGAALLLSAAHCIISRVS